MENNKESNEEYKIDYLRFVKKIELNFTDVCNKSCGFCPQSTFYNYTNKMTIEVLKEIIKNLWKYEFKGIVTIAGRGESTLHPKFDEFIELLNPPKKPWLLNLSTNGTTADKHIETFKKFDRVIWNNYSNEFELKNTKELVKEVRNSGVAVAFGKVIAESVETAPKELKLRNRAGSLNEETNGQKYCNNIVKKMFIDTDGTYRLCCDDWSERVNVGNIFNEDISEYLNSNKKLDKYRSSLLSGERVLSPCDKCDHVGEPNIIERYIDKDKRGKLIKFHRSGFKK